MRRSGITLVDILLTVAIFGVVLGFSVPMYSKYHARNELSLAVDVVEQALFRARLQAQLGEGDSMWSYNVSEGLVFRGDDFSSRNTSYDEIFELPGSVTPSGLNIVTYSRIDGIPTYGGDIILTSIEGEDHTITISSDIGLSGDSLPPVLFKIVFESDDDLDDDDDDSDDEGDGDDDDLDDDDDDGGEGLNPPVYVGSPAVQYNGSSWIPLKEDGSLIIDTGYDTTPAGMHVERMAGNQLRVTHIGGGGKTIYDARVYFKRASISLVENDTGTYATENPFNGIVNNGVGGDEVTTAPDNKSVFFQTRSTNDGDSIIITWVQTSS